MEIVIYQAFHFLFKLFFNTLWGTACFAFRIYSNVPHYLGNTHQTIHEGSKQEFIKQQTLLQ